MQNCFLMQFNFMIIFFVSVLCFSFAHLPGSLAGHPPHVLFGRVPIVTKVHPFSNAIVTSRKTWLPHGYTDAPR